MEGTTPYSCINAVTSGVGEDDIAPIAARAVADELGGVWIIGGAASRDGAGWAPPRVRSGGIVSRGLRGRVGGLRVRAPIRRG